jgi:hypothetical protein
MTIYASNGYVYCKIILISSSAVTSVTFVPTIEKTVIVDSEGWPEVEWWLNFPFSSILVIQDPISDRQ